MKVRADERPPQPSFRCMHTMKGPSERFCARPAIAILDYRDGLPPRFVCAKHAGHNPTPIPSPARFRLVRVSVTVDFVAVAWGSSVAELEAAVRARDALEAAGGLPGPARSRSWMAQTAVGVRLGPRSASGNDPEAG